MSNDNTQAIAEEVTTSSNDVTANNNVEDIGSATIFERMRNSLRRKSMNYRQQHQQHMPHWRPYHHVKIAVKLNKDPHIR